MSIINIIKSSPLFYELFDEEIEQIIAECNVLTLEAGDSILKEGDEGDEIFLILNGGADVMKGDVCLASLKKGDLFGEMVLLDERTRSADIISNTFTDVLVLSYDVIFGYYKKNPKIFSMLMLNLCRLLAKRLKGSGESIKQLNAKIFELMDHKDAS
jgi:signal-transduction protein with cAMP-binding, CBS, and nucleotidyltransferase domain